jgi:Protein of unknown function (DUF2384)
MDRGQKISQESRMSSSQAPDLVRRDAEALVVAKAAIRAAALLDIPNTVLAKVLGVSEASISRMRAGKFSLEQSPKAFELSVLFVRLFRGLDAIVGGDAAAARSWLRTENTALRGTPISLIQSVIGLTQTVQYVDARRARI